MGFAVGMGLMVRSARVSTLPVRSFMPEVSPELSTPKTASSKSASAELLQEEIASSEGMTMSSATFGTRATCLAVIILPMLAVVAGTIIAWVSGSVHWIHLLMAFVGYMATGMAITIGYHRLFTHKSFRTNRFMTGFWAILGSMAVEGPIVRWVGMHRLHHQHSDHELDPHSPHTHNEEGIKGLLSGLWHSHMGWIMFAVPVDLDRYTPDLRKDKLLMFIDRTFFVWVILGLLIPGFIAWAVTGTIVGGLLGILWGGLIRMFMVHHVTWSVNSACHLWGPQHYVSHDHSRNNAVFGIFAFGEGWHNNHHAFPASARHGLKWWQFDISYIVIRLMSWVGLASDVNVPSAERQAAKAIR